MPHTKGDKEAVASTCADLRYGGDCSIDSPPRAGRREPGKE